MEREIMISESIDPADQQTARSYRFPVTVKDVVEPFTPFAMEIDFKQILLNLYENSRFSRHSVIVTRVASEGGEVHVPHALSEDFLYNDNSRGDVLRYNSGVPEPLDAGIPVQMPVFTDWNGDGTLDLILGSTYANTLGNPYNGTWLFRNPGSNEEPVYDDFIRLSADGTDNSVSS